MHTQYLRLSYLPEALVKPGKTRKVECDLHPEQIDALDALHRSGEEVVVGPRGTVVVAALIKLLSTEPTKPPYPVEVELRGARDSYTPGS